MRKLVTLFLTLLFTLGWSMACFATGEAPTVNHVDSLFVLISSLLVFFMVPGVALFYGGMVKGSNIINTIFMVFIAIAIVSIIWILFGYSLAFDGDIYGIIGGFNFLGFNNFGNELFGTIPLILFAIFQLKFAIVTPTLIVGSFVERIKFSAFVIFTILWSILVYVPLAHWVWGGGWLMKMGILDFAGGNVVHISAGIAGLVAAMVIGKRKPYDHVIKPNSPALVFIGTALLWFGWFGFNAGSALAVNSVAINAFLVTGLSAAAAMLSWSLIEYFTGKKVTLLGICTGSIAGLVAITPAAGFVGPISAILIGLLVSPICYFSIKFIKSKLKIDDTLDVFGCHGIGGIWGAIATGLFANSGTSLGLFFGNPQQLIVQIIGVIVTLVLSGVITFLIFKGISLFTSVRVEEKEEIVGLDTILHDSK